MTADKELKNCTFAKTVLMLLIVIYHSMLFWTGGWLSETSPVFPSPLLGHISRYLTSFHIYAFALVSGYIFYFVKFEKGGYKKPSSFLKNKFSRLIIPYIFVSLIWAIPFYLFVNKGSFFGVINKFVLAIAPDQLWFLVMLFVVFAIAFFMANMWKDRPYLGMFSVVFIYLFQIVGQRIAPNIFSIWSACAYLPVFYVGFKLRQYSHGENKFFDMLRKIPSIIYIIAHLGVYILYLYIKTFDAKIFTLMEIGVNFSLRVMGGVMAFFVLTKLGTYFADKKAFVYLSKVSMPVYLFHQQIIYLTTVYLNGLINPYLHSAVNFIVSFAVSVIISEILLKFKMTRLLVGEK